ncbi:MAG: nuclear transport factor 2 family protein [Sphingomicrobium sp.]
MMIWKSVAAVSLIFIATPADATPAALSELLTEEEQLAKAAETLDPAAGIASMLAEDARLYARGGPYNGRAAALEALKANPANHGKNAGWRSIKSGICGDGTHGFTFGYLTVDGGDPKTAQRRYLAYWIKNASGWRVAALKQALKGPSEAELQSLPQSLPAEAAHAAHRPTPDPAKARQGLIDAEKAFSNRAQTAGIGTAFTENGRSDAINSGPDGIKVGPASIGQAVSGGEDGPSPVEWSADDALVAPSGDLGITFGTIHPKVPVTGDKPAAIPFFTIWMRDGPDQPWRYVAE